MQRDKLKKYVIRQVLKIISSETAIDKVLAEYNRYTTEMTSTTAMIEKYKKELKIIDKQVANIVIAVSSGCFNETLQAKIESLETEKKRITEIIAQEKKSVGYLPATKEELKKVYKRAREQLLNGTFEEQKTMLNIFLNKVKIFSSYVEIYVNLIPLSHLGEVDISITPHDFLAEASENTPDNDENTIKDTEKDGIDPSFSSSPLYNDILTGKK